MPLTMLFLTISTFITQYSYPLVVKLYRLFEYICTFKLLHQDFIESVWNNIYIFVSVIVLFAIAIKLISAMVNPDLLTDSKKGAKNYYFRAVAAVILIFLVPIVFEKSFKLQDELLSKNFLSTHVFGYKIADGTNIGQILAWEGFSSFCLPSYTTSYNIDNNYLEIRANMDNIYQVMDQIRPSYMRMLIGPINALSVLIGPNTWEYHPILCPLVGLILVYEMVLLCMDTLFRAAKLAFLQLMTPIVLGAFVFDPSILKKWAKEFFSTYISLFLKVLAMYFIAISISQIQEEISKTDFYDGDWILSGLFKVLLIIALLQLVKKIPDLINKIFGLEIKPRGGIKGRLGEMAGIGGIAQKAWSSLGNVGKLALQAPLVGAYAAADGIYRAKNKGKSLQDVAAFRVGKGALFAARAAMQKGNLLDGVKAYTDNSAPPTYTVAQRLTAQKARNEETRNSVNKGILGGREMINSSGGVNNTWIDSYGNEHYFTPDDYFNVRDAEMSKYDQFGKAGMYKKASQYASSYSKALEGIQKKRIESADYFKEFARSVNATDRLASDKAGKIAQDIEEGKKLSAEQWAFIEGYRGQNADIDRGVTSLRKAENETESVHAIYNGLNGKPLFNGDVNKVALGSMIDIQNGIAESNNNSYEIEKANLSAIDQDSISEIDSTITKINGNLNGAIQNNSLLSEYMDNNGNLVVSTHSGKGITGNYLTYFANGSITPIYKDYGVDDADYWKFDNFVKGEKNRGIEIGTTAFATDFKNSSFYTGQDDTIDLITGICSDPGSVLDKIRNAIQDDTEFGKYLDNLDAAGITSSANFINKLNQFNQRRNEQWRKDPNTGKWIK